ncbi:MAG: hypothetical protein ACE5HD_05785 [Acidobacteriota bacterium]
MQLAATTFRGRDITIRLHGAGLHRYPRIRKLNPSFRRNVPLLKLQVTIDWSPPDPAHALAELQERLAGVSPSFRRHQCRGQEGYRLFQGPTHDGATQDSGGSLEASLALAHLIEHVMIDVISFITSSHRVSGVTGAPWDSNRPLDLFVECPDLSLASLSIHLAMTWLLALLEGHSLNGCGRPTLELARHLYRNRFQSVVPRRAARELSQAPDKVLEALRFLEKAGFACQERHTMNFSGTTYYHVCPGKADPVPDAADGIDPPGLKDPSIG